MEMGLQPLYTPLRTGYPGTDPLRFPGPNSVPLSLFRPHSFFVLFLHTP